MISHRCRYKGRGSVLIRFFTSSTVRCAAARVILAIPSLFCFQSSPPLFYHSTRIGIRRSWAWFRRSTGLSRSRSLVGRSFPPQPPCEPEYGARMSHLGELRVEQPVLFIGGERDSTVRFGNLEAMKACAGYLVY